MARLAHRFRSLGSTRMDGLGVVHGTGVTYLYGGLGCVDRPRMMLAGRAGPLRSKLVDDAAYQLGRAHGNDSGELFDGMNARLVLPCNNERGAAFGSAYGPVCAQ